MFLHFHHGFLVVFALAILILLWSFWPSPVVIILFVSSFTCRGPAWLGFLIFLFWSSFFDLPFLSSFFDLPFFIFPFFLVSRTPLCFISVFYCLAIFWCDICVWLEVINLSLLFYLPCTFVVVTFVFCRVWGGVVLTLLVPYCVCVVDR